MEIGSLRAPGLPATLNRKIECFLAAELSGVIELQVHQGVVRGYKITESGRIQGPDVDDHGNVSQD